MAILIYSTSEKFKMLKTLFQISDRKVNREKHLQNGWILINIFHMDNNYFIINCDTCVIKHIRINLLQNDNTFKCTMLIFFKIG